MKGLKQLLMKHIFLAARVSFYSQLIDAVNQRSRVVNKNNIAIPARVGIIFANLISEKKFTEATVKSGFSAAVLDGGDLYNGPSVMCQSTLV